MSALTVESALEAAGEEDLSLVTQLVARERGLDSIDGACADGLVNLQVLSLSHNRFRCLDRFDALRGLEELNLNFNAIGSLEGLIAPRLTKLFLSNNRLTSLAGLGGRFPKLHTLCAYRNHIGELRGALDSLRACAKLRALDLDGNPCARARGYKHHAVRALGRLASFDGEALEARPTY